MEIRTWTRLDMSNNPTTEKLTKYWAEKLTKREAKDARHMRNQVADACLKVSRQTYSAADDSMIMAAQGAKSRKSTIDFALGMLNPQALAHAPLVLDEQLELRKAVLLECADAIEVAAVAVSGSCGELAAAKAAEFREYAEGLHIIDTETPVNTYSI